MADHFKSDRNFAQRVIEYAGKRKLHGFGPPPLLPNRTDDYATTITLLKQRDDDAQMQREFELRGMAAPPPALLDNAADLYISQLSFEMEVNCLVRAASEAVDQSQNAFFIPPYGWIRTA